MTAMTKTIGRRALLAAGAAALATPALVRAQGTERLKVLLDWGWLPYHSSFFLAQEKGYFRDAGVEVEYESLCGVCYLQESGGVLNGRH